VRRGSDDDEVGERFVRRGRRGGDLDLGPGFPKAIGDGFCDLRGVSEPRLHDDQCAHD